MPDVELVHTAHLGAGDRAQLRALLADVFDDLDEHDQEHALGGLHAVVRDGDVLVGHAAAVQRRLLHGGRALRCGYVEGVAVRRDRRRQGVGAALVAAVGEVVRTAYEVGGLGASDQAAPLYRAHGWLVWRGRASALTPDGVRPTPDELGAIHVLPVPGVALDVDGELTCDWREGDVW